MAVPSWIYIAFLVSLSLGVSCSGRALLPMFEEFKDQLVRSGERNISSLEQFDVNNITKAHNETLFEESFSRLSDCPDPDIYVPPPCHDDDPVFPSPDYPVPCHDHDNCYEPPPCQPCLPPQPDVPPPCDDDDDDDSCYEPPYHQPCSPPEPYEPPCHQPCLPPQPYDPTPCSDDNCSGPPLDPYPVGHVVAPRPPSLGVHGIDENWHDANATAPGPESA